ncbi:MAG: hypothetical protein AAGG68_15560 [Bacteroidota bacterium]
MKFRNYVFGLVVLALSFYSSCTKNDEVLPQQPIDCLGEAVNMLDSFSCESQLAERLSDSNICDVEYIGRYELEDNTKEFAVQYCLETGEEVRYKNKEGDVKKFVLQDKLYYLVAL